MTNMRRWNYIISTVMIIIGISVIFFAYKLHTPSDTGDPGPGAWPLMLAAILIFLAVILIISNSVNYKEVLEKKFTLLSSANIQVYIFMGLTVLFCITLYIFGFIIAALIFIPLAMKILGMQSVKKMLIFDVVIVCSLYIIFRLLLKTPLPVPVFMR